jgi:hypothetical protein
MLANADPVVIPILPLAHSMDLPFILYATLQRKCNLLVSLLPLLTTQVSPVLNLTLYQLGLSKLHRQVGILIRFQTSNET